MKDSESNSPVLFLDRVVNPDTCLDNELALHRLPPYRMLSPPGERARVLYVDTMSSVDCAPVTS